MAEEVLRILPQEEDEADQYLRMKESVAQYKAGNPDPAPVITGAPPQSEDSYATFAPSVIGNPIDGVPEVVIKPSQAVINTTTQAADPGNPPVLVYPQ